MLEVIPIDDFLRAVADLCTRSGYRLKNGLVVANPFPYGCDIRADFYYDKDSERVKVRVKNEHWRYL